MHKVLTATGLYEQQDPKQREHNLRGKFYTNDKGEYALYCLRPTPYPARISHSFSAMQANKFQVPSDGPAGKLLGLLNRHPFRPAHIHFMVSLAVRAAGLSWSLSPCRYPQMVICQSQRRYLIVRQNTWIMIACLRRSTTWLWILSHWRGMQMRSCRWNTILRWRLRFNYFKIAHTIDNLSWLLLLLRLLLRFGDAALQCTSTGPTYESTAKVRPLCALKFTLNFRISE